MKNRYFLTATFLIAAIFGGQAVNAQITIQIPKIPKIKKPKIVQTPESETTTVNNQTNGQKNSPTSAPYEEMDARLSLFLDELTKARKDVNEYTPEGKLYLVGGNSTDWLWRAVSAKERDAWTKKWESLLTPATKKKFDDGLAALAASATQKLPAYKASLKEFSFHNAAEEKMMKGALTKIADYKIFSSGLRQGSWLIDKNDYGLPTARYKHGVIYLRDTKSDHPYCYATYINIKQDYAGGGTYGASHARFIEDEMVGCPAGK